jgi:hypothetical protein
MAGLGKDLSDQRRVCPRRFILSLQEDENNISPLLERSLDRQSGIEIVASEGYKYLLLRLCTQPVIHKSTRLCFTLDGGLAIKFLLRQVDWQSGGWYSKHDASQSALEGARPCFLPEAAPIMATWSIALQRCQSRAFGGR